LDGFTLIELLVGLAIALSLACAIAPLWLSLERAGASEAERTISQVQGRVATARLERDLRLAGAAGCLFLTTCPILEASPSQVVFLERGAQGTAPAIIEWEIANGSLMRRVGRCPASRPSAFAHSLYDDNKTMLEQLQPGSKLAYVVDGVNVSGSVTAGDLGLVDSVVLNIVADPSPGPGDVQISTIARVAR
jgi:prepilin-type N-terminal cleavage/methylation domain-containing protein